MDPPEFHRLADRELNEAAQYYELEKPGLGSSFLREVDRCLRAIEKHPEAGLILLGSVRRRLLRRFPYALLYTVKPDSIRILAVMNLNTAPDVLGGSRVTPSCIRTRRYFRMSTKSTPPTKMMQEIPSHAIIAVLKR